ncbi:hypothetical protein J7I84_14655 [Arthrobacter sp. ISL-85]|uniref:hypothetical protein n=1 Tax=Arthrobacter sp. ISL-85 TaxID=2819115 RepID=UPI001BE618AE|nr:hypothetical protein [Arthrobacter sp. ISL-85]MBT2567717.1 hypothetical protein [Arthrobacter sp. ISL-85]
MADYFPYGSAEYWKKMAETRQEIIHRAHHKLRLLQAEYDAVEAELRLYLARKQPVYTTESREGAA